MRLAALLPARNEAASLGATLDALGDGLPGVPGVVVDSASTDGTAEVAAARGARVVRAGRPGYARALAAGLRACRDAGFERILLLDADGQHPPAEGVRLLAALENADLVIASRAGTRSPAPLPRRAANAALALLVRAATGVRLGDVTSGFQALGPRALALLADRLRPDGPADANVRVLALRAGLSVVEVPVRMEPRRAGASMHDGWAGVRNFVASATTVLTASRG